MSDSTRQTAPYDALLVMSFGGPEAPEDVVPFLRNVTAGRGIPDERLAEVGEHYYSFGGRSPINDQNRALIAAIEADLAEHGIDIKVYWGNRNWAPYLADTMRQMAADGVQRVAAFVTSAYSSYSGCRQYREDFFAATADVPGAPTIDRFRVYSNHPGFVRANVDAVLAALQELPEQSRSQARLVFVTHSIPTSMNDNSGPTGNAYLSQHRAVADAVLAEVAVETGVSHPYDLVFCSRSGAPNIAWLEPDVNDHLEQLAAAPDAPPVVLAPIGFVSDHMEVIYDLDTEAMATAQRLGLTAVRAATAGTHPAFVSMIRDLLTERAAVERGEEVVRAHTGDSPVTWDRCQPQCCANARSNRPALCGMEEGR